MLGKSVYVLLRVSGIYFLNIYRPIYRNIRFLNHQIFVSVTALKILYRSGSILYFNHRIWKKNAQSLQPSAYCYLPVNSDSELASIAVCGYPTPY